MATRNFTNVAASTCTTVATIDASASTVTLDSYTGFPAAPYIAVLARNTATEELVLVTSVVGSVVAITRGYDSTSSASHGAGATFEHVSAAMDFREANIHVNATTAVHGRTGALLSATEVQTMSAKTLSGNTHLAAAGVPAVKAVSGGGGLLWQGLLVAAQTSSISEAGAITGSAVTATGAVSGATVAASGAVTAASVAATGAATAASVAATGAVTGASVAATGAVTAASAAVAGLVSAGTVAASNVSKIVNRQTSQALVTSVGTSIADAGCSVTFTPSTTRAYRVTATADISNQHGAANNCYLILRSGATNIETLIDFTAEFTGRRGKQCPSLIVVPTAAQAPGTAVTWRLVIQGSVGPVDGQTFALTIEDLGVWP